MMMMKLKNKIIEKYFHILTQIKINQMKIMKIRKVKKKKKQIYQFNQKKKKNN